MSSHIPYTVEVLDKLRWNAHLGKHKHFAAAGHGRKFHVWFGVPVIVINVLLGSALFTSVAQESIPTTAKLTGAIFALIAALLGALQTFFNFEKQHVEHRAVGNEYLGIARECERLLALHFDGLLLLTKLSEHIEQLNVKYAKVNERSEALTVSAAHYAEAIQTQDRKKEKEVSMAQRYAQSRAA